MLSKFTNKNFAGLKASNIANFDYAHFISAGRSENVSPINTEAPPATQSFCRYSEENL